MLAEAQNQPILALDVNTLVEENLRKPGEANSTTTPTSDEGDWNTDGVEEADEGSDDNSGTTTG